MFKSFLMNIEQIYTSPLFELISRAHLVHIKHHEPGEIQVCALISYKTGGCPEDCKYCPQAARYQTSVAPLPLLQKKEMLDAAKRAIKNGSSRICIGAAWRGVRDGKAFDTILETVKEVTAMGIEVCCTLGLLSDEHAQKLKKAGLLAYNHNLDSSEKFYKTIITTRRYEDRLETLKRVGDANISICSGGIIGMGESREDRIELIETLASLEKLPESVPINLLIPIDGTPLENTPPLPIWEMLRMIATTRIVLPNVMIRLSAGRLGRTIEEQALCFFAGANSIFSGEKLLTTANPSFDDDEQLFALLGLKKRPPFKKPRDPQTQDKDKSDRFCLQ